MNLRLLGVLALVILVRPYAMAEPFERSSSKARYFSSASGTVTVTPVSLEGGSTLTVISPERWESTADALSQSITKAHEQLTLLFGDLPVFVASVRLIERARFLETTGAPFWTNALFFRGEIMIPVTEGAVIDKNELERALRHEYAHAVFNAFSKGRCPGWLDEGFAQWIEGAPNPALPLALSHWLKNRSPVPLRYLQGGFTKLETPMVAAAYAQSLYASTLVIDSYGFERIRGYLELLGKDVPKDLAFKESFGLTEDSFEKALGSALKTYR